MQTYLLYQAAMQVFTITLCFVFQRSHIPEPSWRNPQQAGRCPWGGNCFDPLNILRWNPDLGPDWAAFFHSSGMTRAKLLRDLVHLSQALGWAVDLTSNQKQLNTPSIHTQLDTGVSVMGEKTFHCGKYIIFMSINDTLTLFSFFFFE